MREVKTPGSDSMVHQSEDMVGGGEGRRWKKKWSEITFREM
jgi:hypothetical protein